MFPVMGRPWRDDVVLTATRMIEQAALNRAEFPDAPKLQRRNENAGQGARAIEFKS